MVEYLSKRPDVVGQEEYVEPYSVLKAYLITTTKTTLNVNTFTILKHMAIILPVTKLLGAIRIDEPI